MPMNARLEARIDSDRKALLKKAADLRGRSLGDFVIAAALEKAEEVLEEATCWRLDAGSGVSPWTTPTGGKETMTPAWAGSGSRHRPSRRNPFSMPWRRAFSILAVVP